MKHVIISAVTLLACGTVWAQSFQRLAITPDNAGSAGGSSSLTLKTIPVDYYRDAPGASNTGAKFNQVYFDGGTEIKLNGKTTDRSFESLVQGETPLFLLEPNSDTEVRIKLNPAHPETKTIQKYEIRFRSHSIIGNITDDRNVEQARIILLRWGSGITVADYVKRAKCLDIMARSNMLAPAADGTLPASFDKIFTTLYNSLDVSFCNDKTFKTLVDSDYLVINAQGALTEQSAMRMRQFFYYADALAETKNINAVWKQYVTFKSADIDEKGISTHAKTLYYTRNYHLTTLDDNNTSIRDTMINGERYVLMSAWKSAGFKNYLGTEGNKPVYKSDSRFFMYPLFLTPQHDVKRFATDTDISLLTDEQCKTRLKQLLGLPPNSTNELFVEFWTKESDLFRPTIDSSLHFSYSPFRLSAGYLDDFGSFSAGSFSDPNTLKQYPFSGLGFTWDYHPENTTHVGVTEFILKENRTIYVRKIMNTREYLIQLSKN